MRRSTSALAAAATLALAFATAGCSETDSAAPAATGTAAVEETNRLLAAKSAADAAARAGLDSFEADPLPDLMLGEPGEWSFQASDSFAEASVGLKGLRIANREAEVSIVVRKAALPAEDFDTATLPRWLAGDYNDYPETWNQPVGDIHVTCYGSVNGAANLVAWTAEDSVFSARSSASVEEPAADSGETVETAVEVTMTPEDIEAIVEAVR